MNQENILDVDLSDVKPVGKIYTKNQISTGTFFGGPLAGTYLIATNFKAFGDSDKAKKTWIYGIICTIAIFSVAFLIPHSEKLPSQIIPLIYVLFTNFIVQRFQEQLIENHINAGGLSYNWWKTIGVSIVGILMTLLPIFILLYFISAT